jgi:tripartite-type tricarboxylate transporter receptor subunit TctC
MARKAAVAICAGLASVAMPHASWAQAAAESAIILGTTGTATGGASRTLGNAISRSMNRAANVITTTGSGGASAVTATARSRTGGVRVGQTIPASGDVLEGTDAPTYRLANGASIRVSGGMSSHAAETVCTEDCPAGE